MLVVIGAMNPVMAQVPAPAPLDSQSVLIMNATAHLGNGRVIENSVIGVNKAGRFSIVGSALIARIDRSAYDTIIDADGKHVYPGFIAPNSRVGLFEIGQVKATLDYDELGDYLPNVRSITSYNTDSKITPTIRTNGVLMAQITPSGGTISGTSSIVHFDAWNWEDAVYQIDDGVHLNWPVLFKRTGWWAEPGGVSKNKDADKKQREIRDFFSNAQAYAEIENHREKNLRFEAMRGIFDGSQTLYVHAEHVRELLQVVTFIREFDLKRVAIVGGYDAWMVTDQLKDYNIAVMLRRVHALPVRPEDDVDLPYKIPFLLQQAGVLFCLQNAGDMEVMNTRNLPFLAGTAAAYGLTKEEALMAITLNTAKILGIDSRVGSIEPGKDATFFISTGDALDMRTNNITEAWIGGRPIDLDNHQQQLYRKFKTKYERSKGH